MLLPLSSRVSVAVASALVLAACARAGPSGAPRPESLLTERPGPVGRQCVVAERPASLPAVDAVVDSTAYDRALRELWRDRRLRAGYAILSVTFDRNGWNARRDVIEHDLSAEVADTLQALFFAHRRNTPPGEPWGARLRVDVDGVPRFRVGRQELCAPRLRSAMDVGALAGMRGPRDAFATSTSLNSIWVRVLVDESGGIADAEIEQGLVAPRWRSLLLNYVQTMAFDPATVDGAPVASWARVPIPLRQ